MDWCCNNGGAAPEEQRYDKTNLTCCTMSQFTFSAPSPTLVATATYLGEVFSVPSLVPSVSASETPISSGTSSAAAQSFAPTTSSTPPPSTSAAETTSTSTPSKSGSSPAAIGAGVGVGVAAAILIAAVGAWWLRRRKRSRSQQGFLPNGPAELPAAEQKVEAPVEKYRAELMSNARPQELHGETMRL